MPLETFIIHQYNQQLLNEELMIRLSALYENHADFDSGEQAVAMFQTMLAKGAKLYLGFFNGKPIAAVGCFDDGQQYSRRLQFLAIHLANLGRNLEAKFLKQVTQLERQQGTQNFIAGDDEIHRILITYEF